MTALNSLGTTWAEANTRGNAVPGRFYGPSSATCSLPNNMYNCVFLPIVGGRNGDDGSLYDNSSSGYYWTSTQGANNTGAAILAFGAGSSGVYSSIKAYGFSVRCMQTVP